MDNDECNTVSFLLMSTLNLYNGMHTAEEMSLEQRWALLLSFLLHTHHNTTLPRIG